MSLTDSRRLWKLASERGTEGVHSHELRRLGVTGNPSQRAKDIADHVPFWTRREARNGRPGSRYWVDGCQPSDAVAVVPNRGVEGGDCAPVDGAGAIPATDSAETVAPLNIVPAPADYHGPTAIVRDFDSDPSGPWRELPWDEKNRRAA